MGAITDGDRPIDHWKDYLSKVPGSGISALGDKSLERVCAHCFLVGMNAGLNYLLDNRDFDDDTLERVESLQARILEDAEKLYVAIR